MKLTDLEPRFLRYSESTTPHECIVSPRPGAVYVTFHEVDTIADAQGIQFLCPKCFASNHGPVGTHAVICWSSSRGVPDHAEPKPGRWRLVGTGYHDLSLMEEPGKSRSVLLLGGCAWHGFVTNGEVTSA